MKGFVFISAAEFFLRFAQAGAFTALEEHHDLVYVVLQSSEMVAKGQKGDSLTDDLRKVEWVPFYPERFRLWLELFDVSCIRFRDRSSSFEIRVQESNPGSTLRGARLRKLARPAVYDRYRRAVEQDMGLHPDILSLTMRERPDFFVLPSALLDCMTDDVLQIAETFSLPTLLLVAGWDNLSSKGLVYHHPAFVGVWGEQSKQHAVQIQGLNPEQVHIVGAPHYEGFHINPNMDRNALRNELGVPPEGKLILFAGTVRLFDETELLQKIDQAIDSSTLPVHVLYRPHPWRNDRKSEGNFFNFTWKHVSMDPAMVDTYRFGKENKTFVSPNDFLFRLSHLSKVYQAVDAVISPMSTVLLEAMLFGLPIMAVAFGDGKHSWSADKVSRMSHFKELYQVPGIITCREREAFFSQLQDLIARIGDKAFGESLCQSTQQFVYRDGHSYAMRIAELVDRMLVNASDRPVYDSVKAVPGKRYLVRGYMRDIYGKLRSNSRFFMRGPVQSIWMGVKPMLKRIAMAVINLREGR